MSNNMDFYSHKAPMPLGSYPHAKRVGSLLFLSGIGPRQRGTTQIPGLTMDASGRRLSYDITVQTLAVFKNVRSILEEAGSDWEHLVDVTVFLTNIGDDFAAFNKVWREHFPQSPPCRTTVQVTALPSPISIELKCIATI